MRADLNVPIEDGRITDEFRINAFLPTLERILEKGGRAIVCSHLGRPKGPDPKFTLAPVGAAMSHALAGDVPLAAEYDAVPNARVVLLENLRFHDGETKNDASFAAKLCSLADAYVNDAFGSCHRAHASIVGPPGRLPSASGMLLSREIENLTTLLDPTGRPYVVVLGGAKVSDKIGVVRNLLERADQILIGGGMCFTFLKALGLDVGQSLVDDDAFDDVSSLVRNEKVVLPSDVVVADSFEAEQARATVPVDSIPPDTLGLDIGPKSAADFAQEISEAKTVFWNGPMGVFEKPAFAAGSHAVAQAVADCSGYTVTGGGDTAAALASVGLAGAVDFASTGGGASLEFLEGKTLPGIAALMRQEH